MKIKEIEGLIEFIAKSGLEEVSIETDQIKLFIKKHMPVLQQITHSKPLKAPYLLTFIYPWTYFSSL